MRAVIPVAGRGKRLRPHTHTQPKVLMNVAGKPILAYILDDLRDLGVEEITFVVGYLAEKVEEFVRERYSIRAHFIYQDEPLGNGHAIYLAREHLTGPTLIVFGDTIVRADLRAASRLDCSAIGVHQVSDPRAFGVVELDRDGFVRHLWEKPSAPPSDLAVVGVYMIQRPGPLRAALERLVEQRRMANGEYWLADALQLMVESGERLRTFPIERWYDCGTPEALLHANHALLESSSPAPADIGGSVIVPPSFVSPTAVVEGSVVGPYVTIAEGARVSNAVLRETIVNANARVEGVLLEDSIIGENAAVTGRRSRINLGDSSEIELT
ncbi:MAG TPA: sugar phosphate nucleotidyltransferase [bacterium]|nr:sugar phosphate nucleotidyltransferase [bacterium]